MKFFIKLLLSFPSTPSSHSEIASSVQWIGQHRTSLSKRGQVQSSFPSLLFAKDRYLFSYHKSFIKNSFCKKTVEAQYSELVWLLLYDADMCILRKSVNNSFTFELIQLTKLTQMNVWTQYVYWFGEYPKGPDDVVCRKSQQRKRNETLSTWWRKIFWAAKVFLGFMYRKKCWLLP